MTDIKVGTRCKVERRGCTGYLAHQREDVIKRLTPKRAYLATGDWFALDDPRRELKPKYLDYTTWVTELLPSVDQVK